MYVARSYLTVQLGPRSLVVAAIGYNSIYTSERQLQRDLSDTRWRCFQHMSECQAADVSVDRTVRIELCVVEGVEGFEAEFE